MLVVLNALIRRGGDGLHHERDCCLIPNLLSPQDKGLEHPIFMEIETAMDVIPATGDTLYLQDEHGLQEVEIGERGFYLTGRIDLWIGGWTHWETDRIIELLRRNGAKMKKYRGGC